MDRTPEQTRNTALGVLLASVLLAVAAPAGDFPDLVIPPSDRVLSMQEVKNHWINTVRDLPIPRKPNGLHPQARERWRANLQKRQDFIEAVRSGTHDTRAELARLEHNAEAWRRQGNEERAAATTTQLRGLREHLARLELLEVQRQAALAQIEASRQLAAIQAELDALRSSCSHACCAH